MIYIPIFALLFLGCGILNEEDTIENQYFLKAILNGERWEATTIGATLSKETNEFAIGVKRVVGRDYYWEDISLVLIFSGLGKYNMVVRRVKVDSIETLVGGFYFEWDWDLMISWYEPTSDTINNFC